MQQPNSYFNQGLIFTSAIYVHIPQSPIWTTEGVLKLQEFRKITTGSEFIWFSLAQGMN